VTRSPGSDDSVLEHVAANAPNGYRREVLLAIVDLLTDQHRGQQALDFGCGDGWFASSLGQLRVASDLVPLEVERRTRSYVEPVLYDGRRIPYRDRTFDLVYAVDVLHHCDDPAAVLSDLMRVCSDLLLIKDHTWSSRTERGLLIALDELGNRRFGVRSPHRYQHGWEWIPQIEAEFNRIELIHPFACNTQPIIRRLTPQVQWIGLWRRRP
jgi:SAM-dependent methyltransferase